MEKAKAAVSDFISKSGKHDTTVHERVDQGVKHETVNPHQREERQIATDREVHQDHYHTTVQPVHDREVLPEQHHHNIVPVEHRTHDNRDATETDTKLKTEKTQFKDEHVRTDTTHHKQDMPSATGEHVHHHIHETIQPVVHKETIEPHVMHTTVPVHEVHHNKAQHHAATALPAMSMDEFKNGGGSLTGREERTDHFSGVPKNLEQSFGSSGSTGMRDSGISGTSGHHAGAAAGTGVAAGSAGAAAAHHRRRDSSSSSDEGRRSKGHGGVTAGAAGATAAAASQHQRKEHAGTASGVGQTEKLGEFSHRSDGNHPSKVAMDSTSEDVNRKPSLMDKLNPKRDADGDGKAGLMS